MTSSEQPQQSADPGAAEHGSDVPAGGSAEARVRSALARLDGLEQRPLSDHAPGYEALHDDLHAVLAAIDGG